MDATTIIALGMAAYALFSGKKKEQELQEKNDALEAEVEEALSKAAAAAAASRIEGQDLEISATISISSIADNLWNCMFEWRIKNTGNQPYYLQDIQSTFSLAGYKVNNWIPGNRSQIRINAGQTMTLQSSINDKKLWEQGESIKKVRAALLSAIGASKISSISFPVSPARISKLAVVDSTSFVLSSPYHDDSNTINITTEIPCALNYNRMVEIFKRYGSNAKDWKN